MNYAKMPLLNPIRFVKANGGTTHFDDNWFYNLIRRGEMKVPYFQKWVKTETTTLYCESSVAPENLIIYNSDGTVAKTIAWIQIFDAIAYKMYKLTFDLTDKAYGKYFAYQKFVAGETIILEAISECIWSKAEWPKTKRVKYKNSNNRFDVAFTLGLEFQFRGEYDIREFNPERDGSSYINQVKDRVLNVMTPSRKFKFTVGDASGVAPWVIDMYNRIFCCDQVSCEDLQYVAEEGAEWEVQRIKGYPLVGGQLDIWPAYNMQSLEGADTSPQASGIIIAYNMETALVSGAGTTVPILEIENIN